MSRRGFLIGASAAGLGLAAFAATRGRHEFEIVHRTFAIANLPDAFQNFRVVQISDIHLEEYTEAWYLEEMVRQTNALQPDLVLLTGDFISRGPLATEVAWHSAGVCAEVLSRLTAPQRLAILGNHDVAVGASRVIDPLVAHGTPVLVNSHIALERGGDRVWICGLDDVEGGHPDFDVTLPDDPRAPVLLMVHEPDFVQRILLHPRLRLVDLMLAGHSHGGQIRLPFAGPLILPPLGKLYPEGLYRFGHTQMYVNRGIGTVGMPFRFNCPSELTHITLVRA
jgi:predicted MPP superfamily phosphohydrolase